MRVDLVGYLMGALDGPEKDRVKQAVDADPRLREMLDELEHQLAPLEQLRWGDKPPLGLAERTCGVVSVHVEKSKVQLGRADQAGVWDHVERSGWRLVDMAIAAGVFAAAAMMFLPAIANSRHLARIGQCQDNMRVFAAAFPTWAGKGDGHMPFIPSDPKTGVAGFYAPQLVEAGLMNEHHRFLCPGSDLAYQRNAFVVPSIKQIRSAESDKLASLQRVMGGSYLYGLGHFKGNQHRAGRLRGRAFFPVISDQVPRQGLQPSQGAHGSRGFNVLFENGAVRYLVVNPYVRKHSDMPSQANWDGMFVSDRGLIEAGMNEDDVVLAPSWARPVPVTLIHSGS